MGKYLEIIHTPTALHSFDIPHLQELAEEIRLEIINTVAKNGGHLAPSLGVVELTLALHYTFNSPEDKIIWDVGHQSYAHKLITGRYKNFSTLRQMNGISGFPRKSESKHDPFGTGHSSTSISAALGMAAARDLRGENYSVAAVIGDGAMTGGMAFEALNHAGHLRKDMIVILNDNDMSIARNVGALSGYLSRIRTGPMYHKGKRGIEQVLRKAPGLLRLIDRIKGSFKYLVVPGMIFEELGFTYLGPVDGHNIKSLVEVINGAKIKKGPVLIHVLTKKGKGYLPAEENPGKFHGIGPFDIESGSTGAATGPPTYTKVFGDALVRIAEKSPEVLAITAAMPEGTGLSRFAGVYPQRFFDVGIAEQHGVTLAAGLAAAGMRPVVAVYSTFLQRAYDQILHDICLQKLPVVFAIDRAGIVGEDGPTHHGLFDISYLGAMPNLVLMAPADENELQHMLATALQQKGPAAIRYPRGAGTGCVLDAQCRPLPVGKGETRREGKDLTLLAVGNMVPRAERTADILAKHGIAATVLNARFIKPLDESLILKYAALTGNIYTMEEHVLANGFGSSVMALLSSKGLSNVLIHRFGLPDCFVEHGGVTQLQKKYGLDPESMAAAIVAKHAAGRKRIRAISNTN